MMYFFKPKTQGVTLIEILVSIGIITMISTMILGAFGEYRLRQSLNGSVETILAGFSRAHLDTIASKNDSAYGVNLKADEIIYFKGATYPGDSNSGNTHYTLPATIEIANISLNGGTSTVFYKKLTGATDSYGTFEVRVKTKTTVRTVVTISQTGATSI